jgi:hypothetical protein
MRSLRDDKSLEHMQQPLNAGTATVSETVARLEQAISLRLGSLRVGVQPLLHEAREHCSVLAPTVGGLRPAPKEQQERQTKLAEILDQMEDVLEALHLAVRSGHGTAMRRESGW